MASLDRRAPARARSEGDRVALDRDVDVEALLAEQDVPDRSADEVDALGEIRERRDRVDDCCEARCGRSSSPMLGRRLDGDRGRALELTEQVGAADDADELGVAKNRHATVVGRRHERPELDERRVLVRVTTRLLMIPRTGACARSWLTALSRSSRPTPPTKRPSSTTKTPL